MTEDRAQAVLAEIKARYDDVTEVEEAAILAMARAQPGVVVFRCICVNDRRFDLDSPDSAVIGHGDQNNA